MPNSPFIPQQVLATRVDEFLTRHGAVIHSHGKRISQYFEMLVYNMVVSSYESDGFQVQIANLQNGAFRYRITPTGLPQNFSYFTATKTYRRGQTITDTCIFEIHHNVAVESRMTKGLLLRPDISVINAGSLQPQARATPYFRGRSYPIVQNKDLQTFVEVKHLNPFPELLISFVGLLNELHGPAFRKKPSTRRPRHLAPSLALSGNGNPQTIFIRTALMSRYTVNIFYGLFKRGALYSVFPNRIGLVKVGSKK